MIKEVLCRWFDRYGTEWFYAVLTNGNYVFDYVSNLPNWQ